MASDEALYSSYHAWRDKYWIENTFDDNPMRHMQSACEYTLKNARAEKANVDVAHIRTPKKDGTDVCAFVAPI